MSGTSSDPIPHPVPPDPGRPEAAPRPGALAWLPWMAIVALALAAGYFAQLYFASRAEIIVLREQSALGDIEAQSLRQQLEAERILSDRRLADLSAGPVAAGAGVPPAIAVLEPPSKDAGTAVGAVVWNSRQGRGELMIRSLPPSAGSEEYQLWTAGGGSSAPALIVSFRVSGTVGGSSVPFKVAPGRPAPRRFVLRVGRPGGTPAASGPIVLEGP